MRKYTTTSFRIEEKLYKEFRKAVDEEERYVTDVIEELIERYLEDFNCAGVTMRIR